MRKIGAVWVIYMLVLGIVGCSGKQNQENDGYSESFFAMDTYMTFTAYGADAETAVLAAEDEINKLEGLEIIECQDDLASAQELRAYIQGYVDCVQVLYHIGLLKENEGLNLEKITVL